jgi:hypothetical protein
MSTDTIVTAEEKARRLLELKKYHQATLDKIDHDVLYRPRMFYKAKENGVISMLVFPSELKLGKDVYTEKIDHDNNSEDSTRTLYKWSFDPNWADILTQSKKGDTMRYLIPLSDLTPVPHEMPGIDEKLLELANPDIDAPMDQMTMRDYYAMTHKVPCSQKKWLNEIITKYK